MNQQYARNLHNLAQASKDYTDGKTSELDARLSEFEPYKVEESDVTITGTQSGFLVVTLSSELETIVLSGKRALFVSGTIMNTLTQGSITTDTLFNVISYDKITQQSMKHVIGFETITTALGFIDTYTIAFMQDNNDQWYAFYNRGSIDTEEILSRIYDLDLQITDLDGRVSDLDSRVTTLENAGGSLYQHNITISLNSYTSGYVYITLDIINKDSTRFTKQTLMSYLNEKHQINGYDQNCNGYFKDSSGTDCYQIYKIFVNASFDAKCVYVSMNANLTYPVEVNVPYWSSCKVDDRVIQIL